MKIAVLTSSRADYGIYLPLLKAMERDEFFDLHLIVLGTHLSQLHGHTIDTIIKDGYTIDYQIDHVPKGDAPQDIARSMSEASEKMIEVWQQEANNYDLVICIGDRYEMFAAVSIAAPFNISFAHIHGGETSLGAIDNEFRHCLTTFSSLHFVATDAYAERVAQIKGSGKNIYTVGALSLDNLLDIELLSQQECLDHFEIDFSRPSLLVTYHPETINTAANEGYAKEMIKALTNFSNYQVIITMPNADAMGNVMRRIYEDYARRNANAVLVENFGTQGYFSAMKLSKVVVGNSSSGIIEAASFQKYVVNIGDRQKGRALSNNVIHAKPDAGSIAAAINGALEKGEYTGDNIYFRENTAQSIIQVLKSWKR